jgi:hypothetical protein
MLWQWPPLLARSAPSLFLLAPSASSLYMSLRQVLIPFLLPLHRPSTGPRAPPVRACEYLFSGSHPLAYPYPLTHTRKSDLSLLLIWSPDRGLRQPLAPTLSPLVRSFTRRQHATHFQNRTGGGKEKKREDALGSLTPWRSTKVGRADHPGLSSALVPGGGRHSPVGGKVGASARVFNGGFPWGVCFISLSALLPGNIRSGGVFNHPSHRGQRGLRRLHPADHGSQSSTSYCATVKGARAAHFQQNRWLVFNVQSYTPIFL